MDGFQTRVTARTCLGFLLLILLQTSTEAQFCIVPPYVDFPENNEVGDIVTNFSIGTGVTPELSTSKDGYLFRIEGNSLIANAVLDREAKEFLSVDIICSVPAGNQEINPIIIGLTDVNDMPPTFSQDLYEIVVNELTPVDTSVYRITATDMDNPTLYYTLKPESSPFKLSSPTNPSLLVATPLEYHKVKNVLLTLEVQDTPVGSGEQTYNDSTTINVTIKDIDNRQPWFQPCQEFDVDGVVICQSLGYTGRVVLNKQELGPLELKPGPLFAIDGDSGINEAITYSIVNDPTNLFAINNETGNITMQRAADVLGDIVLTVRASQKEDIYQFAITTVTISVQEESLNWPKFEKTVYEGVVAEAGNMVMDLNNRIVPLQIIATDEDYSAVGGANPHITYNIPGSNAFRIIEGYLFMIRDLPEATYTMQVNARDETNDQQATAELVVKVESEKPTGGYELSDMLALGLTLGILLLICLVIIILLVCHIKRRKQDWEKIYETTVFRSSLGIGSQKDGIQYINTAFQNDYDGEKLGSHGPEDRSKKTDGGVHVYETVQKSSVLLPDILPDNTSQASSDKSDEKEVKPILTKERRTEEGYKAVWFKEDIDPDAKEEVVIIPDSRANDSEVEDEDAQSSLRAPRVLFKDMDLDDEIESQTGDQTDDSEDDKELSADL